MTIFEDSRLGTFFYLVQNKRGENHFLLYYFFGSPFSLCVLNHQYTKFPLELSLFCNVRPDPEGKLLKVLNDVDP